MRSICLLAVLAAAVPQAHADEPELLQAYGPFKAVGIMLDTGQALLWDEKKSEYRLARVGDAQYGWKVVAIQRDKVVIAQADGAREELALSPAPTEIRTPKGPKPKKRLEPSVVDVTTELKTEVKPSAPGPVSTKALPAANPSTRFTLKRAELDREIADLDGLMAQVDVRPADGGGFVLAHMQNAFLARMGLKEGDIVRSVGGETINTVEDAARVYARLRSAKTFTLEVERAGSRLSLRYDVVSG